MFIANCTNQIQQFTYRVPGNRSSRVQPIAIGGQIQISGELQPEDVDAIIDQHGIYGMFNAATVAQTHRHILLLYSVGREITVNQMHQALERNLVLMGQKGEMLRQEAAVAVNNAAQDSNPDDFRSIKLAITEQPKDGGVPFVNEEIIVRRDNAPAPPPPIVRGRGRPRKAA